MNELFMAKCEPKSQRKKSSDLFNVAELCTQAGARVHKTAGLYGAAFCLLSPPIGPSEIELFVGWSTE